MTEDSRHRAYQAALEALQTAHSLRYLAKKYGISRGRMQRHITQIESIADTQYDPDTYVEAVPNVRYNSGRHPTLKKEEEATVVQAVKEFVDCNTPLTKCGLLDLVQTFVDGLAPSRQEQIAFKENRLSEIWVRSFLKRHPELQVKSPLPVEWTRIQAVSPENLAKNFSRLQHVIDTYSIKDERYIFNIDESGISIKTLLRKGSKKGVGVRGRPLFGTDAPVKGNLDHVTIMPIISAAGATMNPVAVFPGKQPHWRRVDGEVQTLHKFLPAGTLLYHRDPVGADGNIFEDWARKFVTETVSLRQDGQKLLVILDMYGAHRRHSTLKLLRDNDIIVTALPAHCSHVLKPLDVTVFEPFKSYLRSALMQAVQVGGNQKIDVFDLCKLLTVAYNRSLTRENIISGFAKTGIWEESTGRTSLSAMENIRFTALDDAGVTDVTAIGGDDEVQKERQNRFKTLVIKFRTFRREILTGGVVEDSVTLHVESTLWTVRKGYI